MADQAYIDELTNIKTQVDGFDQLLSSGKLSGADAENVQRQRDSIFNRGQQIATAGFKPTGGDAMRMLGQGASLGYGDELEAGMRAPFSDRSYGDIRDQIRTENETYRNAYPGDAMALEAIGGFAVPGMGMAKTVGAAPTLLRQTGRLMGSGGAAGALAGHGYSEADTPAGQALDTGIGAALGVGTGGLLAVAPPVAQLGSRAAKNLLKEPSARSEELIGRLARETGWTSDKIIAEMDRLGPDATMADVNMVFTGQLLGARQKSPEVMMLIEDAYKSRNAGSKDRVIGALEDVSGFKVGEHMAERGALAADRSKAANEMYDVVRGASVPSQPMSKLINNQRIKPEIIEVGKDMNLSRDEVEQMIASGELPFDFINKVKIKLDDKANMAANTVIMTGKKSASEQMYANLAKEWRQASDDYLPGYAEARGTYGGFSKLEDAGKQGRRLSKIKDTDLEDLPETLGALSMGEQEAFRMGALDDMASQVNRGGAQGTGFSAGKIYQPNDPQKQARLGILAGDNAGKLENVLGREAQFHNTFSMTDPRTNSVTSFAQAMEQQGDEAASLLGEAVGLARGNMPDVAKLLQGGGMSPEIATEIARKLTSKNLTSTDINRMIKSGDIPESALELMTKLMPMIQKSQGALAPATQGALQ